MKKTYQKGINYVHKRKLLKMYLYIMEEMDTTSKVDDDNIDGFNPWDNSGRVHDFHMKEKQSLIGIGIS